MNPLGLTLAAVIAVGLVGGSQRTLSRRFLGFIATAFASAFIPFQAAGLYADVIGNQEASNEIGGFLVLNLLMWHVPMLIVAGSGFFLGYLIFAWREARKELGR